jgi:hypothetical protein
MEVALGVYTLKPKNRHLELSRWIEEEQTTSTVLVPEDYNPQSNTYGVYYVEQVASDCTKVSEDDVGSLVVVNDSMVEQIEVLQGEYLLVLENYVYGVLSDTTQY